MSLVADAVRDAVRADKLVSPERLVAHLDAISRRDGREMADDLYVLAGVTPEGSNGG